MTISSTSTYIDIAFVPVYAILLILLAVNLYNHRHNGFASFGFVAIFSLSRVVGNVLLAVAHYLKSSPNLYIAGAIIQSVGFAFLINSSLALLAGVVGKEEKNSSQGGLIGLLSRPQKLAHLGALIATILVIVGMTSIDFTPETLSGQQPLDLGTEAKAGNIIFIAIVILLGATVFYFLALSGRRYNSAQSFTLKCLLFNIVPMLIRSVFLCYRVFGLKNYFNVNTWAQLILQYIPEVIIVIVITALGFLLTYKYEPLSSSESQSELQQSRFTQTLPSYHQPHFASRENDSDKYYAA